MDRREFAISYTPVLRALFTVLGLGPRWSRVTVDSESLRVVMGWSFGLHVPLASVAAVTPDHDRVTGWGVHGGGGTWLVNGSSVGLVSLTLEPPAPARALALIPLRVRRLRVSVQDPEGLIAALRS